MLQHSSSSYTCLKLSLQVLTGQSPTEGLRLLLFEPVLAAVEIAAAAAVQAQHVPADSVVLPYVSAAQHGLRRQMGC